MKFKYIFIFFVVSYNFEISSKRMIINKNTGNEKFKDKNWLNQNSWFNIVPLQEILQNNSYVTYQKTTDKVYFDYPEFWIAPKFPHTGFFNELFLLHIPNGRVQGEHGYVFIDDKISDEMARGDRFECLAGISKIKEENIKKISGRVAVIAQHGADKQWANYYHWMFEVLGRLAMLEMAEIEYDYLYVGMPKKFMKETLELWGIDFSKVIEPEDANFCLQADEIILPSMVINTSCGHKHAGNFQHPVTSGYVREKLLAAARSKDVDISQASHNASPGRLFSKRIFISRKDAYNSRRILNEDDLFALFASKGFDRYELSKMSVIEQILLFSNADIIAGEQGSGFANILFCKEGATVIEIFQALVDNCFWWVSCMNKLNYIPIKTVPVDSNYFANFRDKSFLLMYQSFNSQVQVPLDSIKKMIEVL